MLEFIEKAVIPACVRTITLWSTHKNDAIASDEQAVEIALDEAYAGLRCPRIEFDDGCCLFDVG